MKSTLDRFFEKVEKTDSCWNWTGYKTNKGYGLFRFNGKTSRSHRVIYNLTYGFIDDTLVIDHICKNRSCVNPDHLELVSQNENIRRGLSGKINNFQSTKTHCPKGHEYSGITKSGYRICRRCRSDQQMQYKRRIKSGKR